MEDRKFGSVKDWKKTYGFIRVDGSSDDDKDLFVHHKVINMSGYKSLKPGSRVSFLIGENHMGPMASDVEIEDQNQHEAW